MQSTLLILEPSKDDALLTVYEARLAMNLFTTSEQLDDQIEMLIDWASDEIALSCLRTFGREKVQETFREINTGNNRKIWLSKYPNIVIDSITENGLPLTEDVDFEIDDDAGRLVRLNNITWSEPVVVTYTGGYDLPKEAPPSLKQASIILTRESYYAAARGDASIKLIVHKEARVGYFDPKASAGGSSSGGSPARRTIENLTLNFTRDLGSM
jgi:hypothetical protein